MRISDIDMNEPNVNVNIGEGNINDIKTKTTFKDRVNRDPVLRRKVENGILTTVCGLHLISEPIFRTIRSNKTGIKENIVDISDVPKFINFGVNTAFVIDDYVFDGKMQEKFKFSKGLRAASTIFMSSNTLSKVIDLTVKVKNNTNPNNRVIQPEESFTITDVFNLLPLVSQLVTPIILDNSVNTTRSIGHMFMLLGSNYITRMVAKSGNKKAQDTFNFVTTASTIVSQAINNPATRSMVNNSNKPSVISATDTIGNIAGKISTYFNGSPAAAGYNHGYTLHSPANNMGMGRYNGGYYRNGMGGSY